MERGSELGDLFADVIFELFLGLALFVGGFDGRNHQSNYLELVHCGNYYIDS